MKRLCPNCGKEFEARGFNLHFKHCLGSPEVKELPGVAIQAGVMEALQKEKLLTEILTDKKPEDVAEKIICPNCHCSDVEIKLGYLEPCQDYRCGMCGFGYQVNTATGDFIYA